MFINPYSFMKNEQIKEGIQNEGIEIFHKSFIEKNYSEKIEKAIKGADDSIYACFCAMLLKDAGISFEDSRLVFEIMKAGIEKGMKSFCSVENIKKLEQEFDYKSCYEKFAQEEKNENDKFNDMDFED